MMINIILYILIIIASIFVYYNFLNLLQQNHYHIDYIFKMYLKYINKEYILLLFLFLCFFNISILKYLNIILLLVFIYVSLKKKFIVNLKLTNRIIRIIIINIVFLYIHYTLFDLLYYLYLIPIYILLSIIILHPVEMIINNYYIKKAKKKLKEVNPIIICITGSAGKTSVKNYLYELLKHKYITFKTPNSYNTPLGIAKCINEELMSKCEIAILEYGASHKNDISKLLKIAKPDIGVITNILPQHLKTFKKIENVFNEKLKLFEYSTICVYNSDIISPLIKPNRDSITISEYKRGKYNLDVISINDKGCKFKINNYLFETSLLGRCNLDNLALSVIIANHLKICFKDIYDKVKYLSNIDSRVEIKYVNYIDKRIKIINDSFNSNIKGFKNAIDILKNEKGKKVIITPGIMECGKKSKEINYGIGLLLGECDFDVFIIKSKEYKYIKKALDEKEKIYKSFDKFIDSYNEALKEYECILIENDIPDIYK